MSKKPFFPILVIFLVIGLMLLGLKYITKDLNDIIGVLVVANLILYFATFISFNFYQKAISNSSTQAFLRLVYSAMFLKMVICIAAVLLYAFTFKPVSKLAILIFFGLYFIYTFAEVKIVMRLNKDQKNG